jgi:hypothetical protein
MKLMYFMTPGMRGGISVWAASRPTLQVGLNRSDHPLLKSC